MRQRILMFLALACLVLPPAQGAALVGLSAGQSNVSNDVGGVGFDADDTGWKAFGGYDFMKFFGVEGGYTDMGSLQASSAGMDLSTDISAFGLFARGIVPLGSKVELFGKLGYVFWDAETRMESPLLTTTADDSGNDLAFGAGASFNVAEMFAIRLEYEIYDIDETDDVNFGSVGFAFRF